MKFASEEVEADADADPLENPLLVAIHPDTQQVRPVAVVTCCPCCHCCHCSIAVATVVTVATVSLVSLYYRCFTVSLLHCYQVPSPMY